MSGIIVLLKMLTKYREFFPNFVISTKFHLVFYFEQTSTVTILGEHGIVAFSMMAKPIRALELYYPMIQFLIMNVIISS